jgi:hypothetical protein
LATSWYNIKALQTTNTTYILIRNLALQPLNTRIVQVSFFCRFSTHNDQHFWIVLVCSGTILSPFSEFYPRNSHVRLACVENQGNPVGEHCFASETGTIGPRKMRHKSSIIVTSIAAPRASTATLGKSHLSPGFSSILHIHMNNHQ